MTVGMSNVPEVARISAPPPSAGPAPEMFSAQLQVAKRAAEQGQAAFDQRLDEAWAGFAAATEAWLTIRSGAGPEEVAATWRALLAGEVERPGGT